MQTIQLVLSDAPYARRLKQLLGENGNWPVAIKDIPSFKEGGVVVLDEKVLAELSSPPDYPDRVVLVTSNDPAILSRAWDLGIKSVLFHTDTSGTVLLAIMSAYLRLPKSAQGPARRMTSAGGKTTLLHIHPSPVPSRRG